MLTSGLKGSVEHVLTNTTGNFHLNLVTDLQQECQGWLEVLASLSSGRIAVQMKLPISCKLSKGEQRLLSCQLDVSIHQVSHVLKQQNWMGYSGTNYVTRSRAHRSFIWTNVRNPPIVQYARTPYENGRTGVGIPVGEAFAPIYCIEYHCYPLPSNSGGLCQ